MKYNPKIHHRRSIRLQNYDYSQEGSYFITICTKNRESLFGEISDGKMQLNIAGQIANDEWLKTPQVRPSISLGAFVVMPNHVHGIINIFAKGTLLHGRGTMHRAPTKVYMEIPTVEQFGKPTSNTIPTIIRGYKSAVTSKINELQGTWGQSIWQRNYHEHVIRNEESYKHISEYIINNTRKWKDDCYYV